MASQKEFYKEGFFMFLTIEGTEYENIEVRVSDPYKTIRNQINSIVQVFELPKVDNGGNPIQYLLGQMLDNSEEPKILDFEDENGKEMCLIDYNVQLGDNLHLISVPLCGRQPIKVQVAGNASKAPGCVFEINDDRLWDGSVETFIKYIVESFNLPIFDDGYYIDYSLSIWDGNRDIKCEPFERLYPYIAKLMRSDTTSYGNFEFDLRMFLSAERSIYRNSWGAMFEKWHQYCGHILYKYNYKSLASLKIC